MGPGVAFGLGGQFELAALDEAVLGRLEEGLLTWLEETAAAGIVAGRRSD